MKHVTIAVDLIDANPYRDLKRNPIREDQVLKLIESINETGFWNNVVVREHPEKEGRYQLAYGHNRLEAVRRVGMTELCLPVADLNDWGMYCSMVYENETQDVITPAMVFENVKAGVLLLEKAFKAVGPKGTEEEFYEALGRRLFLSQPIGCDKTNEDGRDGNVFERAFKDYFAGNGMWPAFVREILPGAKLRYQTVAEVCRTLNAKPKAKAKRKKATAKRSEAKDRATKAAEAQARKDREEAERLKKQAEAAEAEAKRLSEEADKVADEAVAEEILTEFETSNQMTDFCSIIRQLGIPEEYHKAAMEHVKEEEAYGKKMHSTVEFWWFQESGRDEQLLDERRDERLDKITRGGNIAAFLDKITNAAKTLLRDINMARPSIKYYEKEKHRKSACKKLGELRDALTGFISDMAGPVVILDGNEAGGTPLCNGALNGVGSE